MATKVDCQKCGEKVDENLSSKMWDKNKRKFIVMCQKCLDEVVIDHL